MAVAPESVIPASLEVKSSDRDLAGQTVTFKQYPTPTAEITVGKNSDVAKEQEKCRVELD